MSYVDYSSHWVLDQFFTFLQANQLGSNDKHIVDNFSTEHNWNSATADGTHKPNSILGSYINKNPVASGPLPANPWIPVAGVYLITSDINTGGQGFYVNTFISGAWRTCGLTYILFSFFDGTSEIAFTGSTYYQKF